MHLSQQDSYMLAEESLHELLAKYTILPNDCSQIQLFYLDEELVFFQHDTLVCLFCTSWVEHDFYCALSAESTVLVLLC